MRFLAVLITLLFLIVGGKLCLTGNKMYDEAQVFPAAENIDYTKFAQERPLVGWYKIIGGMVDLTEGAYKSAQVNNNPEFKPTPADVILLLRSKDAYVPAHNAAALTSAADVILFTGDPDLVDAVKKLARGPDVTLHTTAPRIIKGMVRAPSDLPDRVRRVLGDSITTQSIIVEEYATPSTSKAMQTMAAGGVMILCVVLLWLYIWKQDRKQTNIHEEFLFEEYLFEEDE